MRIVIDFDGTLANTSYYAFKRAVKDWPEKFVPSVVEEPLTEEQYNERIDWDFDSFLKDKTGLQDILQYMNEMDVLNEIPPMEGLKEVLTKLKEEGHELVLCSRRIEYADGHSFMNVIKWLRWNDLYDLFDNYAFVKTYDKSIIGGDVVVDDKIACLSGNRKVRILFGSYHYQEKDLKENLKDFSVHHAKDWNQVYSIVQSM